MKNSAMQQRRLDGLRSEIDQNSKYFPDIFRLIDNPPKQLFIIGEPLALKEGLAVVGARKATPYGISCAKHFAGRAAEHSIVIISGGARGCDAAAHEAALNAHGITVAFLGGGLDELYPVENIKLFQRIVDCGGAVVSEQVWDARPLPFMFRARNRLIAGLARATLIVEAGLPSGTFSTADAALAANRDVLVIPGSVTSQSSRGANRLIYQGATPIIDDDTFDDQLFDIYGALKSPQINIGGTKISESTVNDYVPPTSVTDSFDDGARSIFDALQAQPLNMESLRDIAVSHVQGADPLTVLMIWLAEVQQRGLIDRYPDGRYGGRIEANKG